MISGKKAGCEGICPGQKDFSGICAGSNSAPHRLIEIKTRTPRNAQATPEGTVFPLIDQCDNLDGEIIMLISGVVATASLVTLLVVLLVAGLALAAVDKHVDAGRKH